MRLLSAAVQVLGFLHEKRRRNVVGVICLLCIFVSEICTLFWVSFEEIKSGPGLGSLEVGWEAELTWLGIVEWG